MLSFADRHRSMFWTVMVLFYLAAFNGQWRIEPDAALYLSIGRNLTQGHGYTYLGEVNRLAYPGWPGVIAGTFKVFGGKSLVPIHWVMLSIALATVAATYRLFLIHSGRPTAVVVSFGVGMTKAFFCYAFELWSDMPFTLGVMCALAGYEGLSANHLRPQETRRSPAQLSIDLCFLLGGLAIAATMRPTIWPLLASLVLAFIFRAIYRHSWTWAVPALLAGATAVVGVCIMFGWIRAGSHGFGGVYQEYLMNRVTGRDNGPTTHSLLENIRDLFTWAASDVLFQTRLGPFFNALLSLVVLSLGFGLFRYHVLWGLWFCLLLTTILLSQVTLDRYFLPVLPLLVFAWWDMLVRLNRKLPRQWANAVFIGLLGFGCLLNVTKVCGIAIQQRQRPFLASYDQGAYDGTPAFAKKLHDSVGDKAIILAVKPYGRVLAYLSERFVTSAMSMTAEQLQNRRVLVVEPSNPQTEKLLQAAGLVEGPAMFTIIPSPNHGPKATALSLHSTYKISGTN